MNLALALSFLFFIGCIFGWVLELFFRRFFSKANPERKWINPGFCHGPWLPLYGSGLCILFLVAYYGEKLFPEPTLWAKLLLFLLMAVSMTAIEYLAGVILLKAFHMRLWDYTKQWGNIQGLICPVFSLAWSVLGAIYYFAIHPFILGALTWLSQNLAFSFFVGLFFGVFLLDAANSAQLATRVRKFAKDNDIVVRFETAKSDVLRELRNSSPVSGALADMLETVDTHVENAIEEFKDSRVAKSTEPEAQQVTASADAGNAKNA